MERQSTGIEALDALLGGGLLPGTLTVVMGATGIGKTQLGIQYAAAGMRQEGRRGILFDMTSRGDPQSHSDYAQRIAAWQLERLDPDRAPKLTGFFDADRRFGDYLNVFGYQGRRVTRRDLEMEAWQDWQAEVNRKLNVTLGFLYGNFTQGVRRAVIDGVEPVDRPSESIQFELFEYVYHQVLRKDADWVARDLFREHFREHAAEIEAHAYQPTSIGCMLLYTSPQVLLDELIVRPLDEGDVLANANTIIFLGKIRDGLQVRRALHVAKHRGSECSDRIVPYSIDAAGLQLEA